MQRLAVIADDLTGGLDTGVQFRTAGFDTRMLVSPDAVLSDGFQPTVLVRNTDSRECPPEEASRRIARTAADVHGRVLYKKIDSTMRGNIAVELDALLDSSGKPCVLCTPASPRHGRTVSAGRLFINGVPLCSTAFADDPRCPHTDDLPELLASGSRSPVHHIPLDVIRSGSTAWLQGGAGILLCDAETDGDLDSIARVVDGQDVVLCGSAGLAGAVSRRWMDEKAGDISPPGYLSAHPVLVVAGSRHPATEGQLEAAAAQDSFQRIDVNLLEDSSLLQAERTAESLLAMDRIAILSVAGTPYEPGRAGDVAAALGGLTLRICRAAAVGTLFLTGGATAMAVCKAMGIASLDIQMEALTGIPLSRVAGGTFEGMDIITKAGAFGTPAALLDLFDTR